MESLYGLMDSVTEENGSTENSMVKALTFQALATRSTVNGRMVKESDGSAEANKIEELKSRFDDESL